MTTFIPRVSKLSSNIIRILGCNPGPMTLQGTNSYVIGSGKRRVLIDTGEPNKPEYIQNLSKVLKEEGCTISDVIITHWHGDHIGAVPEVYALNSNSKFWKYPREQEEEESYYSEPIELNELKDGQEIETEGAVLKVVYTPGHTTDHVVVTMWDKNELGPILFSGDCILGEGTTVFEDLYNYMKSLETILDMKPAVIYPGHGPIITNPVPKIQYYIDHRNERESQIYATLATEPIAILTSMQIVKLIYKETPNDLHSAANSIVIHHLQKLAKEGKVRNVHEDYWCINRDYQKNKKSSL